MAIYHLSVKLVSRRAGRSATAAAAYRSASRIRDERTGLLFDYTRKRGVEHTEIVLPSAVARDGAAAHWAHDRERLWNAAEHAEKRKDARVAREYEIALPHELDTTQRRELVRAFARDLADRHGGAVDIAIHRPHREGDDRNHHAHLLVTTRVVTGVGLGEKTSIELKDADRAKRGLASGRHEITAIRGNWAAIANEHLAEYGHAARIDHRTLEAQGIVDREPTYHKGPAVTAIERRGASTRIDERMREDIAERLQVAAERGRLQRESREIAREIIDTSADLRGALLQRGLERERPLDQIRRDAQAEWLASRAAAKGIATQPGLDERSSTIDLSGDMASTRRDAREHWLTHVSNTDRPPRPVVDTVAVEVTPKQVPRLILPDDDLAK